MEQTEKGLSIRDEYGRYKQGFSGNIRRYQTPEEMLSVADQYFQQVEQLGKPATMAGLALALGFRSRGAMLTYRDDAAFSDLVAYLKLKMEQNIEERLISPDCKNVVGLIFAMKNNYGYADKQEVTMDSRTVNLTGFTLVNPNENGRQD